MFRFCGGLEPPDWLLADLPLLSGEHTKVTTNDLVVMCEAIGVDIVVQELSQAQQLFEDATDAKAAVAVLRFILMHASKYDVERSDLVEELQQLGMQQETAEAIAQSYEDHRARIQDQQRAQRFQFPGVEKLEWKVDTPSKVILNLKLDQPVVECNVATTAASESRELCLNMSKNKFLALYEELSQAQSLLHSV
ncbi:hypothetical protein, variant 1 [Phytophthora nicotianae CJ01A1]|uniref:COMM domain-containing protein n=4 Tax=Phytophthora nicotianae TaxID=4792 RepID=W2Q703_PHYN3|nr:hypothetical protein, variant 1 [Phytophthora nicotianae INRA-310]ETM46804.1 hypothetical protein, variant 1 [Phytophthora nicotianae]ETN08937.1 hypothetical protein, variant 1 [Phytophthora nicotianae INRA-310]ETP16840.1 hypothetical protein, variant 1 [Phytophthora nicotianae CJ01A1]ETP44897.1 hypothetical protein, variant 1 [Phytophthora nicotianae P10297]